MKKKLGILCLLILLNACTETEILNETGSLEITNFSLPNLPNGYFYEAWLLVDNNYVSVGVITNDSVQNNRARFQKIDAVDLSNAQSFAITVENQVGAPSDYVLLLGDFNGNSAELHTDFTSLNGSKSLATRISGAYTVQNASVPQEEQSLYETNGVWFFKGTENSKIPTLKLDYRELSYQAWLVKTQNTTDWNLNIGVIKSDTLADNWKGFIPTSYSSNIPDFPGEDFLQEAIPESSFPDGFFPLNVQNAKVVISPIFENYTSVDQPFPIYLLESIVPNEAQKSSEIMYELQVNTSYKAKATKL